MPPNRIGSSLGQTKETAEFSKLIKIALKTVSSQPSGWTAEALMKKYFGSNQKDLAQTVELLKGERKTIEPLLRDAIPDAQARTLTTNAIIAFRAAMKLAAKQNPELRVGIEEYLAEQLREVDAWRQE